MFDEHIFTDNYRDTPYWWDTTLPPQVSAQTLPPKTDVAIIGSGYTGLCAAIQTARGGLKTIVLDSDRLGWGASSRNGGQVSNLLKPSLGDLTRKYGSEKAFSILREGHNSLSFLREFITDERFDCDLRLNGKFRGAHSPAQYEAMAKKYASQTKGLEIDAYMVPKSEQRTEIGTDAYYGGAVLGQHFALNPAKYHGELLKLASSSGVTLISNCGVKGISRQAGQFRLHTPEGALLAREVIIATSGYTGKVTPWLRRRIIPIGSYMIATEELPTAMIDELFPKDRIVTDSRRLVYYYRASPDRRRILFGGRVAVAETNTRISAGLLRAELVKLFPKIENVKVSHSWMGFVDFTFDSMPHLGKHEGIHYALGYCGSGIALASYLGTRIGQQVLGKPEGKTALDRTNFSTRPFYSGNPWFLSSAALYYRWLDKSDR